VRQRGWRLIVKRSFDHAAALVGLIVLCPVLAAVALVVRATMGAPVLFRQVRPGLGGRPFRVAKFRTMLDRRDREGRPLPDAERLTRFGLFLRSSSLDELPQLWSVLRGDLSLVGPRPLLTQYLERYTPAQARRHEVLPGITGWAQVNGRNSLSWEEKFALDIWYVDNWSLALDAKILLMTLRRVVRREGISQAGHATMTEFMGDGGVKS
jgi:lipopolysaccharide/colanic/teichoic acid biosynthesis glycosyltransferase